MQKIVQKRVIYSKIQHKLVKINVFFVGKIKGNMPVTIEFEPSSKTTSEHAEEQTSTSWSDLSKQVTFGVLDNVGIMTGGICNKLADKKQVTTKHETFIFSCKFFILFLTFL